ncbi:hypothetical protein R3P38DRAFT_2836193 [Favolaschia claudopus]|uniref:Uncharacterized protein n=1 Tax=Favolaschia claudopus TaxID=2862362 RepID=A0AAW0E1X0_9AGAR
MLGVSLLTVFFLAAAPIVTATRRAYAPPGPPSNPCPPTNLLDMRLTASGVSAENGFMIDTCSYETTTTLCGISDCKIQSVMCSYFGSTGGAPQPHRAQSKLPHINWRLRSACTLPQRKQEPGTAAEWCFEC